MVAQTGSHILLVEDDIDLAHWIADYLIARDFKVTTCHRGDEAVALIGSLNPDIVLLDGMLPGMDGLDVCKTVRASFTNPIIMITARDEEIDEVLGLEMGADDYITKPVRARVLLARIRALLRREEKSRTANSQLSVDELASNGVLKFSGLLISAQARSVILDGESIKLSSNEFDVLWFLASKAGQVVSRKELVSHFRGFDYDGFDRSIDLRISRLRKKLKDDSSEPFRIKTIWGKGYLFAKDVW
ncbi:two-component system response regulator [Colwellia sp. MT41]|uniref:DNA-binding response regulator n=1 Tax=Colwellia marinimaniae TaxID=1513592 RepID=A0ABQ0MUW5_9GAMM|nr:MULTISPECIES: response regulator [Colwellia]ALO34229.1 two-component system response regulator [Colwellia sp. MT41]GAW96150.1 DNA-binding response regulator [Colwellia marinimaniae]